MKTIKNQKPNEKKKSWSGSTAKLITGAFLFVLERRRKKKYDTIGESEQARRSVTKSCTL